MRFAITIIVSLATLVCRGVCQGGEDQKLVVHEWGTFTSLQDETGAAVGGINSDEEQLPDFVRTLEASLVAGSPSRAEMLSKSLPKCEPAVTMRLETPVIYFYPPAGTKTPLRLNVSVEFHGGWLTQFYPGAEAITPGLEFPRFAKPVVDLTSETVGRLTWRKLLVGSATSGPTTDYPVWLAPRKVPAAANVTSVGGESEKFLFYRGVGRLDSPLRVKRKDLTLFVWGQAVWVDEFVGIPKRIKSIWLVDIDDNRNVAFAELSPRSPIPMQDDPGKGMSAVFPKESHSSENLAKLRHSMHAALVADGLFADEADALLTTWDGSYFRSAGTRLFYLVPRAWTDHYLPLKISVPADVTRVMVGRIELLTSKQRDLLKVMSDLPQNSPQWQQAYRDLGRFREALLLSQRKPL